MSAEKEWEKFWLENKLPDETFIVPGCTAADDIARFAYRYCTDNAASLRSRLATEENKSRQLESDNAALRARVEKLEKVRERARICCILFEYMDGKAELSRDEYCDEHDCVNELVATLAGCEEVGNE